MLYVEGWVGLWVWHTCWCRRGVLFLLGGEFGYSPGFQLINATCHGHEFSFTLPPPIIRSGLLPTEGDMAGIPHFTALKLTCKEHDH